MDKPKCKLIGQDGNIFNLMSIASRTLKSAGLKEQAEEMIERISNSGKRAGVMKQWFLTIPAHKHKPLRWS